MRIGTIYTVYGRRAGAELAFERTMLGLVNEFEDIEFVVFCNDAAIEILPESHPRIVKRRIRLLNNQIGKALWTEYLSARALERDGLDLFWIPSGTNSFPGRWRIPSVVTFYDLGEFVLEGKYGFARTAYRKYVSSRLSAQRAGSIVTISKATLVDVTRILRPKAPCRAVYLGATPHLQAESMQKMTPLEAEQIGTLDSIFLCPGQTDYRAKGLDVLVRGYQKFCAGITNPPPLICVGPKGKGHELFEGDVASFGLGGHVRYLGRVSDDALNELYNRCVAVLYPTRFEGFGFPVLEAMQHGVPVICSRVSSLPEVGGDAALYFEVGDAEGLCAWMQRVYREPSLVRELTAKGQNQLKKFSWQRCCTELREVFESVAGGEAPAPYNKGAVKRQI